ncbi:hypothetical protein BS50DRAFT_209502 [Corynespora cassiicola Philippines]|uniref:Uncharacterized protein n=1 Tax=Corynespora cassiicola Philippines TaxID=1448308 RepID=A0A2T2N5V8_CORCC|nr:hypothetical protein BS50DRAFT_209502 [Corynespora cassiicola Philippines]
MASSISPPILKASFITTMPISHFTFTTSTCKRLHHLRHPVFKQVLPPTLFSPCHQNPSSPLVAAAQSAAQSSYNGHMFSACPRPSPLPASAAPHAALPGARRHHHAPSPSPPPPHPPRPRSLPANPRQVALLPM